MEKLLLGLLFIASLFLLVVALYLCFTYICLGKIGEATCFFFLAILFTGTTCVSFEGLKE